MNRAISYLALLCGLLLTTLVSADERILNYQTNVMIHPGGELTITEDIRVRAEGNEIRRGIYRDFPTRYKDRFGNHYTVEFSVESILRDGAQDNWHTEEMSNGIRVYIGSADHFLNPGEYTYQIRFRTSRQLGYFADRDELYWNVTGNGWAFPIDFASARISLPFSVPAGDLQLSSYSGSFGSKENNVRSGIIDGRTVEFATTQPLAPWQGLTVSVSWPKGLMAEPTAAQKIRWFVRDNGAVMVLALGLILAFLWYNWAWNKVGRDPKKGVIIPRFQPPTGLSPAACRYVLDMSFNRNAFTAAIISLAVKGRIQIEEKSKKFTLSRRADNNTPLTKGETSVLQVLLPRSSSSLTMENTNHQKFQQARNLLNTALKSEYAGRLFHLNTLYMAPPVIITAVSALIAAAFNSGPAIWISWLVLSLLVHGVFIWLLRAPTPAGRLVMDEIEGFKSYLGTAEQDRLDRMRSPTLTPEVFESFLPYAYALGVENKWCERFARELPEELRQQSGYQPNWYSGNFHGTHALNHLGDNFGSSFSSAISSASSAPGSSSGGGGGGSSGGGGGGGGGGGW